MSKVRKTSKKRGRKLNHLQLDEENWENAVKRAVLKKKPANGWPKKHKKRTKSE